MPCESVKVRQSMGSEWAWCACRCVESAAHQNCQYAAVQTCSFLRDWLGPRIFAGRLTPEQQQLMQQRVPTSVVHATKGCFITDSVKPCNP